MLIEGLYISLGGYTRHPFHGDIHYTILFAGLQHFCTESLALPYFLYYHGTIHGTPVYIAQMYYCTIKQSPGMIFS